MITLIANRMIEDHEVTIMAFDSPEKENRSMYGLDERVAVDYVNSREFKDNRRTPARYARSFFKWMNNKTGLFNRPGCVEFAKNIFYPKYVRKKWADYFNEKDYDLVIATAGLSLILAVISDDIHEKTAGWMHNCYDAYLNQKGVLFWKKNELLKKYFAKMDAVLVLNKYDKVEYDDKLGLSCKIMENPRSFVSEKKTDITQKNFFVAARFVEAKGMDLLLRSFKKFCEVNDDWNLIIAGDGPLRPEVLEMTWKYKLQERIRYIGVTDNVEKYYLESSVYLLSSRWEGWGLVIIEAFEMGLPVVAYDIVPVDLLITSGIDGFIVEKFDAVKFAAAMVKLANDEELRREMSEKAIEKAKMFSVERIYEQWTAFLSEMESQEV